MIKKLLLSGLFVLLMSGISQVLAEQVTIAWDAHPDTDGDLAGFELHYGDSTNNYVVSIAILKDLTAYTMGGLERGKTYYIALLAFDTSGNKSAFSNEVSYLVPLIDITPPEAMTINIPEGTPVEININP